MGPEPRGIRRANIGVQTRCLVPISRSSAFLRKGSNGWCCFMRRGGRSLLEGCVRGCTMDWAIARMCARGLCCRGAFLLWRHSDHGRGDVTLSIALWGSWGLAGIACLWWLRSKRERTWPQPCSVLIVQITVFAFCFFLITLLRELTSFFRLSSRPGAGKLALSVVVPA